MYEKAGFRVEGVLRESLRHGGQWIDATMMSILASEWAEHHGHPSQGTRLKPGDAGPNEEPGLNLEDGQGRSFSGVF